MMRSVSMLLAFALAVLLAAPACHAGFGPAGMEPSSAQAVYKLPRDHAMHGAAKFYETNDYMEWYYFTSFVRDVNTNEPITLFWTLNAQGFVKKNNLPFLSTLFSAHNMETGFLCNTIDFPDKFDSVGSGPDADPSKFRFSYTMGDANSVGNVTYDRSTETWYFKAKSSETKDGSTPYDIDLQLRVFSPGYIPATPMGIETEGYNWRGDWNPETAYGLSYYVTAPQALLTGTADLNDGKGKRTVRGTAWIEHQWGNFRGPSNYHSRYQWAWARLDNGDMLTLRQWHRADGKDGENGVADLSQNRYIYLHKLLRDEGFRTEYAWGPSIKYSIAKNHTLPNGQKMPLWAKLETPQGVFFLAPEFPNQQAKTAVGLYFWEGVKYLYTDPQLTKRVGRMFGEFFEVPNKKFEFVRQRGEGGMTTKLARPLNGGLPPMPDDALTPLYPQRTINNIFKFAN